MVTYKGHEIPDEVAEFLEKTGLELLIHEPGEKAQLYVDQYPVPQLEYWKVIEDSHLAGLLLMIHETGGVHMVMMQPEQARKLAKDLKRAAKR